MFLLIGLFTTILAVAAVFGSAYFCVYLEQDRPAFWTGSLPARILAVILQQPAVIGVVVIHTLILPIALVAEALSDDAHPYSTAMDDYIENLKAGREYYLEFIPAFVLTGDMD